MQNALPILGLLLGTVFALSNGQSTPRTVLSVEQCFEDRQTKCQNDCASKLPQNKTASIKCFANLISEGKAEFKKCLADAGITDSSPCFALNHTRGEGPWDSKGGQHGPFERRRGHNHTSHDRWGGFDGRNIEHRNRHKFGQDNKRRVQRSLSNSNSNSTESSEEKPSRKLGFGQWKKHGGAQGGRHGGLKGQGGAEMREYHQCLVACFKSEDAKPCDDGCPPATVQISAAFKECKKQGFAKGVKEAMIKCLHPEQPTTQ